MPPRIPKAAEARFPTRLTRPMPGITVIRGSARRGRGPCPNITPLIRCPR